MASFDTSTEPRAAVGTPLCTKPMGWCGEELNRLPTYGKGKVRNGRDIQRITPHQVNVRSAVSTATVQCSRSQFPPGC